MEYTFICNSYKHYKFAFCCHFRIQCIFMNHEGQFWSKAKCCSTYVYDSPKLQVGEVKPSAYTTLSQIIPLSIFQTPWNGLFLEIINSHLGGQEMLLLLWKHKVHYRVQKIPPLDLVLSQINPVHNLPTDLLKMFQYCPPICALFSWWCLNHRFFPTKTL